MKIKKEKVSFKVYVFVLNVKIVAVQLRAKPSAMPSTVRKNIVKYYSKNELRVRKNTGKTHFQKSIVLYFIAQCL